MNGLIGGVGGSGGINLNENEKATTETDMYGPGDDNGKVDEINPVQEFGPNSLNCRQLEGNWQHSPEREMDGKQPAIDSSEQEFAVNAMPFFSIITNVITQLQEDYEEQVKGWAETDAKLSEARKSMKEIIRNFDAKNADYEEINKRNEWMGCQIDQFEQEIRKRETKLEGFKQLQQILTKIVYPLVNGMDSK